MLEWQRALALGRLKRPGQRREQQPVCRRLYDAVLGVRRDKLIELRVQDW